MTKYDELCCDIDVQGDCECNYSWSAGTIDLGKGSWRGWDISPKHPIVDETGISFVRRYDDAGIKIIGHNRRGLEEWFIEKVVHAYELLNETVDADPHIRGGLPVLKNTGFTVAQLMAELSESSGVGEVSDDFDLDEHTVKRLLIALSLAFERPAAK